VPTEQPSAAAISGSGRVLKKTQEQNRLMFVGQVRNGLSHRVGCVSSRQCPRASFSIGQGLLRLLALLDLRDGGIGRGTRGAGGPAPIFG
jgi:hypothetical protein